MATLTQLTLPVLDNGTVTDVTYDLPGVSLVKTQVLAANGTTVTFTGIPTTGNNIINFYIDGGANYTGINTATSGQVTLSYDAESAARNVYCEIKEV